jgi:hypothetical protein
VPAEGTGLMTLDPADQPAASLSAVTAGDLDRSPRQREIRRPGGFADELRVVLAGSTGVWGALTVFREARRPFFSSAEVQFVSSIAGLIDTGYGGDCCSAAQAGADDVGLLILDADDGCACPTGRGPVAGPAGRRRPDGRPAAAGDPRRRPSGARSATTPARLPYLRRPGPEYVPGQVSG